MPISIESIRNNANNLLVFIMYSPFKNMSVY